MSASQWPQEDREWLVRLLKTETKRLHDRLDEADCRQAGIALRLDELERAVLLAKVERLEADRAMASQITDVALLRSAGAEAGKEAADAAGKKWVAILTAIVLAVPPLMQQCQSVALPPSREKQSGAVQQPVAD